MADVSVVQKPALDLQSKSIDWFLYDRNLCHESFKVIVPIKEKMVSCFVIQIGWLVSLWLRYYP